MTIKNTTLANNLYPVANATSSSIPFVDVFNNRDPTTNDVQYQVQKKWFNTSTNSFWILTGFTTTNGIVTANWEKISSGAVFETVTGNTGPAVPPTGNNINIVGDGTFISTSGNAATSTLTISLIGSISSISNYTNVTHAMSPYTVNVTIPPLDYYLSVDCSSGPVTLLFPNVPTFKQSWIIKDRTGSSATNNISVTTVGGAVMIDGVTTYTIQVNYESIELLANATPTYEVF